MFGDKRRLVALHESSKPSEMSGVNPLRAADGHADTMQRNRVVAPDAFERTVGWPARSHIIFSMNLEEAVRRSLRENCVEVFVLEACAGQTGDRVSRKAEQAWGLRVRKFEHGVHGLLRFPSGRCRLTMR
jgi:hypothetical protein